MKTSTKRFLFYAITLLIWSFIIEDIKAVMLMLSIFALSELIEINENTKF